MTDSPKVTEVFGISREVPLNYIFRDNIDDRLVDSLTRDRHIVIFGSSKQGKTCLRKQCLNQDDYIIVHCNNRWDLGEVHANILKRAGYELTQSTRVSSTGRAKILASIKGTLAGLFSSEAAAEKETSNTEEHIKRELELDIDDVNDVIAALRNIDFTKFIILEDFHYLKDDAQRDISVALKAFHENSPFCFIVIGVWLEENRLVLYNGDLTGRLVAIDADEWTEQKLHEVINRGADLLNVAFSDRFCNTLIRNCFDNVYLVQETCHRACINVDVHRRQPETSHPLLIGPDDNWVMSTLREIVDEQSGRYAAFVSNFAQGFQETSLDMYSWLAYAVLTSTVEQLVEGLTYRELLNRIREKHPRGKDLNPGNLTQALQSSTALQVQKGVKPIVLDYDQTNRHLKVVDRGFLIWIQHQNKDDLLALVGVSNSL